MASIKELQDQMNKNSSAWHSASQAEKDRLHKENVKLQNQIDSMTGGSSSFDSVTGTWSSTPGRGGGSSGSSSGSSGGGTTPGRGNSASGIGVWSDEQQSIIDRMNENSSAWHEATTQAEKDRLHAENQYLSSLLGGDISFDSVSGTWSGSAGFDYAQAPNEWEDQMRDWVGQILNREPFQYNYLDDPNYQQYREAYLREGQRAMQDTIGEVSARTGGLASSYATSAANQANNYYMAALADKIPELREMAYQAYLNEIQMDRDDLALLMDLDSLDYNRYLTERDFAYGQYRDQISDSRYNTQWQYQLQQDALNRQQQEAADAYNRALDRWQILGYLDEEGAAILNFPVGTPYPGTVSASSSGGNSRSSGDGDRDSGDGDEGTDSIVDTMLSYNNDARAKSYLLDLDLSQWKTDAYWELYQEAKENQGQTGTSGNSAVVSRIIMQLTRAQRLEGLNNEELFQYLADLANENGLTDAEAYAIAQTMGLM